MSNAVNSQEPADPYLWLESVDGPDAIAWAKKQNAISEAELQAGDVFKSVYPALKKVLDSSDRIPMVEKHGRWLYNFWRDAKHPRGIWRRTTEADYVKIEPAWETIIDLDDLNAREKAMWVWTGASFLEPAADRCMVRLSRGGGDAVVAREFDVNRRAFVEGGFTLPEAKLDVDWHSPDGGYENAQLPYYSSSFGISWLERGGALVVANLRGGGEFGPAWHQAALRENRQKSFDDFTSIAEDLIARKITSPKHLGIMGGSHGGLLVGVAMIQRPELFNAVVSAVPLLDMKRYSKLLAGASWMSEYGDPDVPADWAHIGKYSPYQNVRADGKYPRVFFTTSTRDDRVHPAHARKMVARMLEQKHSLLYYENIEGGHAGAADNDQSARIVAMEMAFFWKQLR